jgi:hypothetical protein
LKSRGFKQSLSKEQSITMIEIVAIKKTFPLTSAISLVWAATILPQFLTSTLNA